MKTDIEICHIYMYPHYASADYIKQLENFNNTFYKLIAFEPELGNTPETQYSMLLDDTHITEEEYLIQYDYFFRALHTCNNNRYWPKYIVRESKLASVAELIFGNVSIIDHLWMSNELWVTLESQRIKALTVDYENRTIQYSCAMLSAAWQAIRLGAYKMPKGAVVYGAFADKPVKPVSVLDKKFMKSEDRSDVFLRLGTNPSVEIERYYY